MMAAPPGAGLDPEWAAGALDARHGVLYRLGVYEGELHGVEYVHPRLDNGKPCAGWAPVQPANAAGWEVVQTEPLTLSPSLLCRACGHHGFIRDGRWIPA